MADKDLTPKPVEEAMPFDGMFFTGKTEEKKEEKKGQAKPVTTSPTPHKKEKKDANY